MSMWIRLTLPALRRASPITISGSTFSVVTRVPVYRSVLLSFLFIHLDSISVLSSGVCSNQLSVYDSKNSSWFVWNTSAVNASLLPSARDGASIVDFNGTIFLVRSEVYQAIHRLPIYIFVSSVVAAETILPRATFGVSTTRLALGQRTSPLVRR